MIVPILLNYLLPTIFKMYKTWEFYELIIHKKKLHSNKHTTLEINGPCDYDARVK